MKAGLLFSLGDFMAQRLEVPGTRDRSNETEGSKANQFRDSR